MPKNILNGKGKTKFKIPRHGPSVNDMKLIMSGGDADGKIHPGHWILSALEFFKPPLEKEDQAELNKLIEQKKEAQQLAEDKKLGRDTQERLIKLQLKQKEASENATRKEKASQAAAQLSESRAYHGRMAPWRITKMLQGVLEPLWRNIAPYVALAIVIIVAVSFLKGGGKKSNNSRQNRGRNPFSGLGRTIRNAERTVEKDTVLAFKWTRKIFRRIIKFFEKLFHPLYQITQFFNLFSGGAHSKNVFDRTQIQSGRCDNINWLETTDEGKKGVCDIAKHPTDLTWNLDTSQTPEYFELPQSRKSQLDIYNTVKIPWDVNPEASFYVPQCEKAYYPKTCTKNGICIKADMFEDLGLTCKAKNDKLPTQYPIGSDTESHSFDDATTKKCIDINTLSYVPCP